jgi:hypothetical protein
MPESAAARLKAAAAAAAAGLLLAGWGFPAGSVASIRTLEPRPGAAQCNYELLHAFARLARQCRKQTPPCWYTLGAGTLIGALRNEPPGLLQWEHDVDVYVPARSAAAILDILQREGLIEAADALEGALDAALNRARGHERVADVRIGGFLAGIQLHDDVDAVAVADHALEAGVITRVLQNRVLQISPPFVVTPDEVDTIVDTLMASVDAVARVNSHPR